MKKQKIIYGLISVILFLIVVIILSSIDKTNSIRLSLIIQIFLILYISKIIWGCIIYVKEQYNKRKYSYSIIMNLGLILFLSINVLRQINLLIVNWNMTSINDIYVNTLNSFSYFAVFILPLILFLAIYSILTNIVLIYKEGLVLQNILGIVFGASVVLGAIASQYIFDITKNIEFINYQIYIKKFIDIGLNSILCYFYCLTLATLYCNIKAAKNKPDFDKDYVIILGSKIKDNGTLTPILQARVDKAIEFAKEQKNKTNRDIVFVPSGGKGKDEIISEAEAMKNYLIERGIDPKRIIIEDKSINTYQNITFSKKKIDENNKSGKIIFATTNYHVFRSGVIANNEGIECEGIGSATKWYFYTNAVIREFIANIFIQKGQHLALITLINISIFILVLIGSHYNLI